MSEKTDAADGMPSSIGRYEINGSLGFGAMGAVYRAFDPVIKRPLAIKTIRVDVPRQSPQYRSFIERFYQEARISGTLSHPNIVTLFDIGEEGGVPFLAMEYVDGQTIAALLEQGVRFKPERVITLMSQVAAGLDYAHSRGVVHRDIKPSNLIVQEGDKVKVTDFGIAKLVDTEFTQSGTLLGTPSYMSPEQAMGEKLDGRSDIFSLGVCAFEMMSGLQPFPGTNVTSILYRLVHVAPVEPGGLAMNGLVPSKWREVFQKVLAKKPDNRYQSAGAFVRDLELCLGSWFAGLGEQTLGPPAADESTVTLTSLPSVEGSPPPEEAPATAAGEATTLVIPVLFSVDDTTSRPEEGVSETVQIPSGPLGSPDDPAAARAGLDNGDAAPLPTGAAETVAIPPPGPLEDLGPGSVAAALPEATHDVAGAAAAAGPWAKALTLPAGGLLVGAAGLFLLAAVIVGWLLWQRGASPGPVETPHAMDSPPVTAQAPPLPTTGSLRVGSEPEGARVVLNGTERGATPLELLELPFGAYEVRVELKGHEGQTHDVSLSAEEPSAEVRATLSRRAASLGRASFASSPAGARVSVDGTVVGRTPVEGVLLPPGRHAVEILLEGYARWSGAVEVAAGRPVSLEVPLEAVPTAPPTPPPVDTARVYENKAGSVDRVARRKSGDSPSYPSDRAPRLKSGERVSVTFSFEVSETGQVEELKVEESAGRVIDDAVISAVRSWRYEPAQIRGTAVRVRIVRKQTFLGG